MYARRVTMKLKPNTSAEFTKQLETEVIPLLRKQKGFQDEIAFATADGKGAFGISLWDRKESAEEYNKNSYAQVTKMLGSVTEGTPQVEGYEVSASTLQKAPAASVK